jgi:hypothetical protein
MSWKACLRYTDHPMTADEIEMAVLSKDPYYQKVSHYVTIHAHGGGASTSFNGEANQVFTYTVSNNGGDTIVGWNVQNQDVPVSFVVVEGNAGTYSYLYDAETSDAGLTVPGTLQSIAFGYAESTVQLAQAALPTPPEPAARRRCLKWVILATGEKICVLYG